MLRSCVCRGWQPCHGGAARGDTFSPGQSSCPALLQEPQTLARNRSLRASQRRCWDTSDPFHSNFGGNHIWSPMRCCFGVAGGFSVGESLAGVRFLELLSPLGPGSGRSATDPRLLLCLPNLRIWASHVGWIERCLVASAVFGRWEWEDGGGQDDCSPIFRHLDGHLYWTVLLYPALSP